MRHQCDGELAHRSWTSDFYILPLPRYHVTKRHYDMYSTVCLLNTHCVC